MAKNSAQLAYEALVQQQEAAYAANTRAHRVAHLRQILQDRQARGTALTAAERALAYPCQQLNPKGQPYVVTAQPNSTEPSDSDLAAGGA